MVSSPLAAKWKKMDPSSLDTVLDLTITVKENNDALSEMLMKVSEPSSPLYGKHLTKEEVDKLASNPDAQAAVATWIAQLESKGAVVQHTDVSSASHITLSAPISVWNDALGCTFYDFVNADHTPSTISRATEYYLPEEVSTSVAMIHNVVQLPMEVFRGGGGHGPKATTSSFASSSSAAAATASVGAK